MLKLYFCRLSACLLPIPSLEWRLLFCSRRRCSISSHPFPLALMQPHWLSLCPRCTTSSFSPQGLCTDTQVPTHLHTHCLCVYITHMYAGTVIHPKSPQRPSPAHLSNPYSQVGLQAGQAIPQKVWPLDWWDSLGSCGQCPCPTLRGWHCPCVC